MKYYFFLIVFLVSIGLKGQTKKIDSLVQQIHQEQTPRKRLGLLIALWQHHESLQKDSLWKYQRMMQQMAIQEDDRHALSFSKIAAIDACLRWDNIDSAAALIEAALPENPVTDNQTRSFYFKLNERKITCLIASRADYAAATELLLNMVSEAKEYKDSLAAARSMNLMSVCNYSLNNLPASIQWAYRGLMYCERKPAYATPEAALYINLASSYAWTEQNDSAQYCLDRAIPLCKELQNLYYLANAYIVQANLCKWTDRMPQAEEYMLKALDLRVATEGNITYSNEQLALANIYYHTHAYNKAIAVYKAGIDYAEKLRQDPSGKTKVNYDLLQYYYEGIGRSYKAVKNNELYEESLKALISVKDSFYTINSARAIAELQTRYEVKQKEATITEQQLDIARKNNILVLAVSIAFVIATASFFLFRSYREKKSREMSEAIVKERSRAIRAVADAEENERKRIAADLHDNLGAYAASIASNIDVIQAGNKAGLNNDALRELSNNSQTMVAQLSDTIWALNKDSLSLTAISDRVKVLLNRLRRSYSGVDMEVIEDIDRDIELPPTQAFHLFQIIQEATINALKHSGADRIEIRIHEKNGWEIVITDFGKGMGSSSAAEASVEQEPDLVNELDVDRYFAGTSQRDEPSAPENAVKNIRLREGGNGLKNMQARAVASGWNLGWHAVYPSGTNVTIYPVDNIKV